MTGPAHDPGVNYRALSELFALTAVSPTSSNGAVTAPTLDYQISMSVVEIYNETLKDLLVLDNKKPQPK